MFGNWCVKLLKQYTKFENYIQGYKEYYDKDLGDEEIDELFNKVDADGSGEIEYSEFVIATMNEKNLLSNNKL